MKQCLGTPLGEHSSRVCVRTVMRAQEASHESVHPPRRQPFGMQIQASFWLVFRRLCAEHLAQEPAIWRPISQQIDTVLGTPQRYRDAAVAALVEALADTPDALDLGFRIGTHVPLTAYGAHSLALLAAPTAGDALQWISDARRPGLPLIECRYETDTLHGRLTIGLRRPLSDAARRLIVAIATVFIDRLLRRVTGRSEAITAGQRTQPSAGNESGYQRLLTVAMESDAVASTVIVDRAVLDTANPAADADTFDSIRHACRLRSEAEPCGEMLRHRVRDAIMSNIASPPSQQRLAQMLGLTPRQFRNCLQRERASYQVLVRQCRTEYASELLLLDTSLSRIAERLGYSDLSAFSHAFFSWTGRSPSEYREELRAGELPA